MIQQEGTNMAEVRKGAWSPEEDRKLISYIRNYGIWNWNQMPKFAGLARTGKSCRLRWMNYLRPDVKRGPFTKEEVEIVIKMYISIGNRWSAIAAQLPGRSDNEIKNFYHTHLKKHLRQVKNVAAADQKSKDNTMDDANTTNYSNNTNNVAVLAESVPRVIEFENDFVEKPQEDYNLSGSVVILESSPITFEYGSGSSGGNETQFSLETVMDILSSSLDYDANAFWYDVLMEAEYLKF